MGDGGGGIPDVRCPIKTNCRTKRGVVMGGSVISFAEQSFADAAKIWVAVTNATMRRHEPLTRNTRPQKDCSNGCHGWLPLEGNNRLGKIMKIIKHTNHMRDMRVNHTIGHETTTELAVHAGTRRRGRRHGRNGTLASWVNGICCGRMWQGVDAVGHIGVAATSSS